MKEAIAYIDGFNLYYGSLKGTRDKWLDIQRLCEAITPKSATLVKVRYFTAKVKPRNSSPTAHTDQGAYLKALGAHCPLVNFHYGSYQSHTTRMANANPPPRTVEVIKTEEKGSDVNLAVHMLNDAFQKKNLVALLISNDSDVAEAVCLAREHGSRVHWFPPTRNPQPNGKKRYPSHRLAKVCSEQRAIYPSLYKRSQLPDIIKSQGGTEIRRPNDW